jgi:predicted deacetylase
LQLLVSLHDVTPFHAERLKRAEALLAQLRVPAVTYLLVPDFHGLAPVERDDVFQRWCRRPRPFRVHWALHGWRHVETTPARRSAGDWWKRRWLTGGEGEFLALENGESRVRLTRGRTAFTTCLRTAPTAFVAPAWLFRREIFSLLAEFGIRHTEDHRHVYDLAAGQAYDAPVLTWATRTVARRVGSRIAVPILHARRADAPLLRIALHPFDFDHPATVGNLTRVLTAALARRDAVGFGDLAPGAGQANR